MQTSQGTMLETLRAVQQFLDDSAAKLAVVVNTGARQRLTDAIAALSGHATDQQGSNLAAQSATQKKRSLRTALLRDHMAKVARIAAADLPVTPQLEPLKMPKGRPTAERLAALAYGMAQTATPYTDAFVSAGLPQDFLAQLTGAADAMLGAINERNQNRGKRGGATTGLKSKLSAGRKIVHILDAFVKSAAKDDPSLLRNWNLVKRVPRVTGRLTNTPPAATTTTAAPPVPASPSSPSPTPAPTPAQTAN